MKAKNKWIRIGNRILKKKRILYISYNKSDGSLRVEYKNIKGDGDILKEHIQIKDVNIKDIDKIHDDLNN